MDVRVYPFPGLHAFPGNKYGSLGDDLFVMIIRSMSRGSMGKWSLSDLFWLINMILMLEITIRNKGRDWGWWGGRKKRDRTNFRV